MDNVLGNRIKLLRENARLSQIDLAKVLHIGNTTVSQYESGARVPSDTIKISIAQYFGVSLDYLMGMTDIQETASCILSSGRSNGVGKTLSPHEERVILAYRAQPALQAAVDKLLDVKEAAAPSQTETA